MLFVLDIATRDADSQVITSRPYLGFGVCSTNITWQIQKSFHTINLVRTILRSTSFFNLRKFLRVLYTRNFSASERFTICYAGNPLEETVKQKQEILRAAYILSLYESSFVFESISYFIWFYTYIFG